MRHNGMLLRRLLHLEQIDCDDLAWQQSEVLARLSRERKVEFLLGQLRDEAAFSTHGAAAISGLQIHNRTLFEQTLTEQQMSCRSRIAEQETALLQGARRLQERRRRLQKLAKRLSSGGLHLSVLPTSSYRHGK